MKIRGKKISVRFPVPPPGKPHGTEKGKKGYNRSESRREERNARKEI